MVVMDHLACTAQPQYLRCSVWYSHFAARGAFDMESSSGGME